MERRSPGSSAISLIAAVAVAIAVSQAEAVFALLTLGIFIIALACLTAPGSGREEEPQFAAYLWIAAVSRLGP